MRKDCLCIWTVLFLYIFYKYVKNHLTKFGGVYNKCIKNIAQISKSELKEVILMYHNYRYQVICMVCGVRYTYTGMYINLCSESEAIAALKRQYANVFDYDVWEA